MSTNQNKIIDTTEIDLEVGGAHSHITYQVVEADNGRYEVWMFDPNGRKIDSCASDLEAMITMMTYVSVAKDNFGAVEVSPFG